MPTLTEEIKKVLNIYYWNHNQNPATKDLLSLIQSTVKGCVPEKYKEWIVRTENVTVGINNLEYKKGYNQAIDTITSNLKKAGVL